MDGLDKFVTIEMEKNKMVIIIIEIIKMLKMDNNY
jgi:hypothetical protein